MTTPMALICKVLFPSISTFETPPSRVPEHGSGSPSLGPGFPQALWRSRPKAVREQPPLASALTRVLRQAVCLSRRHAKEVQGVPDTHEVADAVQGVGMLPGDLRLRQFRRGMLPALPRPRGVSTAHEAKRIPLPAARASCVRTYRTMAASGESAGGAAAGGGAARAAQP